ncbi:MAG: hypothetical protein E7637_08055 [Ruminococcaceae bacterium]|nr:hypothetical protein [Oscillospiraceae bacterium]
MAADWNDIKYTLKSPEQEKEERREAKERKKEEEEDKYLYKLVPTQRWHYATLWSYEWRRMYKMMGWKSCGYVTSNNVETTNTGEYYLEKTSATTYNIKEKQTTTSTHTTYGNRIKVPKDQITDMEGYLKLVKEVEDFLCEAEESFGSKIVPSYFNPSLRFLVMLSNNRRLLPMLLIITWIGAPLYLMYLIYKSLTFDVKYAKYRPLAKAYEDKVKDFNERLKKVSKF